jgi:ferredoxin
MTKIYYFSGTGNSLWSAKKIAQTAGDNFELYNIGAVEQAAVNEKEIIIQADAVVIVFPSYAFGLPLIVRRFVKKAVFKTPYIASFVTFGSTPGGTMGELRRLLKKKGKIKLFFGNIPSVENYLAIFRLPKPEKIQRRLGMQEKATEEAARAIIERKENRVCTIRPFSSFISWLFSFAPSWGYKRYRVKTGQGGCNGCGICEKICPAGAINMENGRPVFTNKCEHCQGCVDMCPLRAIQFGRVKFGSPGWRHPGVEISELTRPI